MMRVLWYPSALHCTAWMDCVSACQLVPLKPVQDKTQYNNDVIVLTNLHFLAAYMGLKILSQRTTDWTLKVD